MDHRQHHRHLSRSISVSLFSCVFVGWLGLVDQAFADNLTNTDSYSVLDESEIIPGEWIVKVKPQANSTLSGLSMKERKKRSEKVVGTILSKSFKGAASSLSTLTTNAVYKVKAITMSDTIVKIKFNRKTDGETARQILAKDGSIAYVEPNLKVRALGMQSIHRSYAPMPEDPRLKEQWDMLNFGQASKPNGKTGTVGADINVVPAWKAGIRGSKYMTVAVIDTGVDWDHPELRDNIFENPGEAGELSNNGVDDDENGIVDDVHGANFVDADSPTNDSRDDNNHGTHCSGTIGARGDNGEGISGINWNVSILPVKFLSAQGGGSTEGAINGVLYAARMGVKIMSNSWGSRSSSKALQEAIEFARDRGILFVAAAGNDGANNDSRGTFPANYKVENVMSVAATDNFDKLAYFSNYGKATVHIAAPGQDILSTVMNGGYEFYNGTSMATPHVAGAAALLWSVKRTMSYEQIKNRLMATAVPMKSLDGKVMSGRLNVWNAIKNIVSPQLPKPDETKFQDYAVDVAIGEYGPNEKKSWDIKVPNAKWIRVVVDTLDLENNYDFLTIKGKDGADVARLTGKLTNYTSEAVEGDSVFIQFSSDAEYQNTGFKITKVQVIY